MILLLTNRGDYTADFLIIELKNRGAEFIRFNTEDFPKQSDIVWQLHNDTIEGYFLVNKRKILFDRIKSIWYRRPAETSVDPGILGSENKRFAILETRAALEGAWRTLDCFWVSNPDYINAAEYKLLQLKNAQKVGFKISPTLVTNVPSEVKKFFDQQNGQVVYKTLDNPRIERGDTFGLIYTTQISKDDALAGDAIRLAPSLFQTFVPKKSDIRVTVIGTRVFPVEIRSQDNQATKVDWRNTNPSNLKHLNHDLPLSIEKQCVGLLRTFGLQFGAIDLVLNEDGEYIFLEINPNGQWAWIEQMNPEIHLREALADILIRGAGNDEIN